jgi:predicted kinase
MLGRRATERVDEAAWRGAYDPAFSDEVYAEVFRRAEVVLASGRPVILDASFRSEALRGRARELARAHGLPFRFVECRASPETCRERLVWRAEGPAVSDGRLAIFDDFVARFEPITELSAAEHVVVDTARPLQQTLALVEERVDTWPRGLVA